ncbi:MAG: heavy-metal-associated domain-containing protein [Kordiimonadaceae bacterium]|nr:heavy-metal-associated domain-containing protein [Kordiimonadaceae bacterium]
MNNIIKTTLLSLASAVFFTSTLAAKGDVQYDIKVDGITCPFCVATSEKALKKIDGVHAVGANLDTGIISVCGTETLIFTDEQLKRLFRKKGFTYRNVTKHKTCTIEDHAGTHPETDAEKNHAHAKESKGAKEGKE